MSQTSILDAQDWTFPIPIAYGPGRLAEIGERCRMLGVVNPLIVTDRGSRELPFVAKLQSHLETAGLSSGLFFDVSPNPQDVEIGSGCDQYKAQHHDAIIAIGGGSAMDAGKSICLTANNEIDLWAFEFEQSAPQINASTPFPTLITIPTTAGTGAETESTAMVTHTTKGMKFCLWHPELKPSLTILDPELTLGLPENLTAWTGVDALVHAIEAYTVPGFHPLCDAMALEALYLISTWLPRAVSEPDNIEARGGMLVGSCLAGISFQKGLGLVHAISHMIGAEYDTHHGLTNAIVLPVVLRYNLPDLESKVKRMCEAMGLVDTSVKGFLQDIEATLDALNIPRSLADIDIPKDCSLRIAEKAILDSAAGTNPRAATVIEIQKLVDAAIMQAR